MCPMRLDQQHCQLTGKSVSTKQADKTDIQSKANVFLQQVDICCIHSQKVCATHQTGHPMQQLM